MGDPKPLTAYQQTYHWRNKNCGPWAQEWIKSSLPGLSVEQGSQSAKISEVTSVTGDCDLGQRKGKLLTIYDLEVEASWTGVAEDGSEVKGSVKVPEVSHEAIDGLSDYVYEFRLSGTSTPAAQTLLTYLKTAFPPILSDKFNGLRPALLAVHGNPDSGATSGTSTPTSAPATTTAAYTPAPPAPAPEPETKKESKSVASTSSVEVTAQLQASAEDIWGLLTDESRIPMWSRSPAKLSLTPGSPFELFGGNVRGKIEQVEKPTKLVQTWQPRHPNWPSGELTGKGFISCLTASLINVNRSLRHYDYCTCSRIRFNYGHFHT
ncbi:activator of Hsp90 ATPase [Naematelia encephala]|uniref:Activator of Hsp90 ATPase n=1 Tax=Naematelia encephala TaxID=71784 RepID=A0A1Y2BHT6_9TREE|nr:activator of Hsp90 ATPase [Naematelia encephala]